MANCLIVYQKLELADSAQGISRLRAFSPMLYPRKLRIAARARPAAVAPKEGVSRIQVSIRSATCGQPWSSIRSGPCRG